METERIEYNEMKIQSETQIDRHTCRNINSEVKREKERQRERERERNGDMEEKKESEKQEEGTGKK